jgi:uncharacterized protein (TIGR00730 family)
MSAWNTPVKEKTDHIKLSANKPVPFAVERKEYIMSGHARGIRVLAEFEEFPYRLGNQGIRGTYLFFGSARSMSREEWDNQKSAAEELAENPIATEAEKAAAGFKLARLKSLEWACHWWQVTHDVAKKLTEWSISPEGVEVGRAVYSHWPKGQNPQPLVVCTGGGPGFMEAANKGAVSVPGGLSMGVGVTLPFEANLNPYITPGYEFQYEYFFSRKFMEVYCAKAMIVAPGGMGTCDEMFEVLTLMQTGHMRKIPCVLLGRKFWNDVINFKALADYAVITKSEVDELCFTDSAEEAAMFIINFLKLEADAMKAAGGQDHHTPRK